MNNQMAVVLHENSSLVNIAGPGSGKTHTLISKISHIVELNGPSIINHLLVLTFTKCCCKRNKK